MAYSLPLPDSFKDEGWKIKIRDKERVEAPHVTVIKGVKVWRINLRNNEFLDEVAPPRELPKKIRTFVEENLCRLRKEWDRIYSGVNPVNKACPNPNGEVDCEVCREE